MSAMLQRQPLLRRAPMYPVIIGTVTSATTGTSVSSFGANINIAGAVGDLLILTAAGGSSDSRTLNTPSGWSPIWEMSNIAGNLRVFGGWYRIATGAEGATIAVSASSGCHWSTVAMRIARGTFRELPTVSTSATGTGAAPNPNSLTATRPGPHLWLAIACGVSNDFVNSPAEYTTAGTADAGGGTNETMTRIARRFLRAASEDPGAFSITGSSTQWAARTVCIHGWS
jgi:hypothetical protein